MKEIVLLLYLLFDNSPTGSLPDFWQDFRHSLTLWNSYTRFLARQRRQSRQLHLTIEYWHFDFYLYVRRQLQFWFPVSFYSYLAPFLRNQHWHTGSRHTDGLCLKIRAYRYSLTCRRFPRPHPTTSDASHTCIFAGDLRRNLLPRR